MSQNSATVWREESRAGNTGSESIWAEANLSVLVLEFARLRGRLKTDDGTDESQPTGATLEELRQSMQPPPAIDTLSAIFDLTAFERDLVLLCAGIEMDSTLAARCGEVLGRPRDSITFALALAVLSDAHWSALAPTAPLRRYRLIEMEPGHGVTSANLRIDERILHYLAGVNRLDARLEVILQTKSQPVCVAEEHRALAAEAIRNLENGTDQPSVLHLCGDDPHGQEDVAALLAFRGGRQLYVLRHENMPAAGQESDQFIQLWTREAELLSAVLLLQLETVAPGPNSRPSGASTQLMENIPGPLFIASREPLRLHRPLVRYEVNTPQSAAQKQLWQIALGPAAASLNGHLDDLAEQFRLSAETIFAISQSAIGASSSELDRVDSEYLWNACRAISRPQLEHLAERIASRSSAALGWDDLILPQAQKQALLQLASQSRYRMKVYETWGFATRGRRGLGLNALFSGPSGTGKTLAAEVLAGELKLDLYRIDLSAVVSKYIGETEKNLRQIFDAAEAGGVLLLFDEADALFGKRTEVKDSHDRYANIEVGYLLQRMESFQGLAILTTNLKSSLDKSFQRRLRFVVDFPFPDAAQREAIWARAFPEKTPTRSVDLKRLAQLNVTGGNIRNIALNAAFLAAAAGLPVSMEHLLQATRLEAIKIERPLSETEIRGWL
jgi:hypothetical protein